jgi:hypothetical protein
MQYFMYSIDPMGPDTPPPSPELMAEMGKFVQESIQAGVMVATGGLAAQGTRVTLANGKYSVTDGPFVEAKELMGGFAIINVKTLEEAIGWAKRFRDIVGEGTSEIVPIYGPQ